MCGRWTVLDASLDCVRLNVTFEYDKCRPRLYYYYYLLQLSFHSVAVVLTLVQTKQIIYINETVQKHSKYKYTYYQNTHT